MIHLYLPHSKLHFPIWPLQALSLNLVWFPSAFYVAGCQILLVFFMESSQMFLSQIPWKRFGLGKRRASNVFQKAAKKQRLGQVTSNQSPIAVAAVDDRKAQIRSMSASLRPHLLSGSKSQAAYMPSLPSPG